MKIKRCPFCGGGNILKINPPGITKTTLIECKDCMATVTGWTVDDAIKKWNTRKGGK